MDDHQWGSTMIGGRYEYEIQIELINKLVAEQHTVEQAMHHALEAVKPGISNSAYQTISKIDFSAALNQSRKWIQLVIKSDPPPTSVYAFFFGIFDTSGRFGRKHEWQQMYISGADCFDPNDEGEWACDCLWQPKYRYPRVPLMKQIGKLCPFRKNQAGFTLISSFVAALALDHASIIAKGLRFEAANEYPIATGHDSGDIHLIGYITPQGVIRPKDR